MWPLWLYGRMEGCFVPALTTKAGIGLPRAGPKAASGLRASRSSSASSHRRPHVVSPPPVPEEHRQTAPIRREQPLPPPSTRYGPDGYPRLVPAIQARTTTTRPSRPDSHRHLRSNPRRSTPRRPRRCRAVVSLRRRRS
ncbi:hypothetical protein [Kibdelosporangium philippinense]|uniref:hypothetical protein n=1 Tax=Kibdelosporangium philippinense TaxID=211113 RepID=UPI003618D8C8